MKNSRWNVIFNIFKEITSLDDGRSYDLGSLDIKENDNDGFVEIQFFLNGYGCELSCTESGLEDLCVRDILDVYCSNKIKGS